MTDCECNHGPNDLKRDPCADLYICTCGLILNGELIARLHWHRVEEIKELRADVKRLTAERDAMRENAKKKESQAAKMDATGGPICWCGRSSAHESGWCGTCYDAAKKE